MTYVRRVSNSAILMAALVAGLLIVAQAAPASNEVLTWNETATKAVAANGQSPVQVTRTLAMVQVAVHDALNAINRRYAPYYFDGPAEAGAWGGVQSLWRTKRVDIASPPRHGVGGGWTTDKGARTW